MACNFRDIWFMLSDICAMYNGDKKVSFSIKLFISPLNAYTHVCSITKKYHCLYFPHLQSIYKYKICMNKFHVIHK